MIINNIVFFVNICDYQNIMDRECLFGVSRLKLVRCLNMNQED